MPRDEVPDPQALSIRAILNGTPMPSACRPMTTPSSPS
ncbi:MAG: hypothetical protein ACJ75M_13925 [Actinomycetes bacterium]